MYFFLHFECLEKFEDTKEVVRGRKSKKDKQYYDKKKKKRVFRKGEQFLQH